MLKFLADVFQICHTCTLTNHITIFETQNPRIHEFYVFQKPRTTDFEALNY